MCINSTNCNQFLNMKLLNDYVMYAFHAMLDLFRKFLLEPKCQNYRGSTEHDAFKVYPCLQNYLLKERKKDTFLNEYD